MCVAYKVLTEGGTLEVGKVPGRGWGGGGGAGVREARAGGSRVSRGRSQVDLAGWQATQWFKLGNKNIDLTELS